jgi:NAD(P)-dependent dehydrogenase (short-subunit alcohol dehydrogenase family)
MELLKDKVAVIYGAGGAIGGAVAQAFAREGARVFRTGRLASTAADVAAVDALDERAVDAHLDSVVAEAGRVDISFNAIGIADTELVGVPLVDLSVERFARPIAAYLTSYFLTARLAARRMAPNRSGVIMTVSALPGRAGTPLVGGYGPAMAGKEALTRSLSAELAPHGIRVVGLRPHAMPETASIREVFDLKAAAVMTWDQWQQAQASRTHPRRLMTLDELADVAAFIASDRASGMTGTTVNLTLGTLDD